MNASVGLATPVRPPLFGREFSLLITAHFLQALGGASTLLLPRYLAHLGASRTELGMLMAITALSGLASRPLVGWALDTIGRKPTVIVGTACFAVSMQMLWFVDRLGPLIVAQRVVAGLGMGTLFAAYFTFAADLVPARRRTEGLALFGVSGLLPLLINPLADRIGVATPEIRTFLPSVGLAIALSLIPLALLREPARAPSETPFTVRAALDVLRRRSLLPVWLAAVLLAGLVGVFQTYATVAAEKRGIPHPSSVWFSYAIGSVTVRLFGARLPDRIGPHRMVLPSVACYLIGLGCIANATDLEGELLAGLFAGIGHGTCFPVLTSQVVSRVPDAFRGTALACYAALWGMTELVMTPLFGGISDRWGDLVMFQTACIAGAVSLAVWWRVERRLGPRSAMATA